MKRRYEALLVLNTSGSDDSAREIIERLEKEFQEDGAQIEQIQKMDRREFAYVARDIDSGYFVNFIFEAEPVAIEKLKTRLRLDADVHLQHYQQLRAKKVATAK